MRNLILASAFLAVAAVSHAENGVVASVAMDDAPVLNAPLSGPAFIDPVFTAEKEEAIADAEPSEELALPEDAVRRIAKDAEPELMSDAVAYVENDD